VSSYRLAKALRCKACKSAFSDKRALKNHNRARHRVRGLTTSALYFSIAIGLTASLAYSGAFSPIFTSLSQPAAAEIIHESVIFHIHPRLEIFIDGQQATIPANVGIDPKLWKDRTLERYGMPMPEMKEMPYMSPIHTHDTSGTLHLESTANRIYTLGDFFDIWGVRFNATCVLDRCGGTATMLVNGVKNSDFRSHVLKDGELIRIEFRRR